MSSIAGHDFCRESVGLYGRLVTTIYSEPPARRSWFLAPLHGLPLINMLISFDFASFIASFIGYSLLRGDLI